MRLKVFESLIVAPLFIATSSLAAGAISTQNGDTGGTYTAPRTTAPAPSGGNINGAAKSAGGSNASGMIGNVVAAGAYVAASDGCTSKMLCAMAAVSLVQSLLQGQSKSGDDKTAGATEFNPYAYGPGGSGADVTTIDPLSGIPVAVSRAAPYAPGNSPNADVTAPSASGIPPAIAAQSAALRSQLAEKGYSVSPDGATVKLPNGKKVSSATLGSESGMRDMGLSESQAADVRSAIAKAGALVASKLSSLQEGGGGGSGSGGGSRGGGDSGKMAFDAAAFLGKGAKDLSARSPKGMTRQLDGEKIGASVDNIFMMVSRQYLKRDQADEFLKH